MVDKNDGGPKTNQNNPEKMMPLLRQSKLVYKYDGVLR